LQPHLLYLQVHSGYQLQYIEPLEGRECAIKRRD
jgi:hypothetical protein